MNTALVHSDEWARFDYGPEHPLRMERLGLTWRLMDAYGLTALPNVRLVAPDLAGDEELARFHAREYLDVLEASDSGVAPAIACRYGLGPGDNPVFPGIWEAARLAAGGSLLGAKLIAKDRMETLIRQARAVTA